MVLRLNNVCNMYNNVYVLCRRQKTQQFNQCTLRYWRNKPSDMTLCPVWMFTDIPPLFFLNVFITFHSHCTDIPTIHYLWCLRCIYMTWLCWEVKGMIVWQLGEMTSKQLGNFSTIFVVSLGTRWTNPTDYTFTFDSLWFILIWCKLQLTQKWQVEMSFRGIL